MSDLISKNDLIQDIRCRSYIGDSLASIFETIIDEQLTINEKEIRDKAIDDFYRMISEHIAIVGTTYLEDIEEIADQMKKANKKIWNRNCYRR